VISATEALELLRAGNRRFVSDERQPSALPGHARRTELLAGQNPFAIVLGCADSRVPAELIFDQGLGDLFVIRVAGNVVGSPELGSVEFAAEQFGSRLVVVLGHSSCGAVLGTLESIEHSTEWRSEHLRSIVEFIRPSVEGLLEVEPVIERDELIERAVRANISASARRLRTGSVILEELIDGDGLVVVGAEYSLETGEVHFFDGVPAAG
jgi:carbonic anhydrase